MGLVRVKVDFIIILFWGYLVLLTFDKQYFLMKPVAPTPIKFDEALKKAIKEFADKKELGNVSVVVKKAVMKYIKYNPKKNESS